MEYNIFGKTTFGLSVVCQFIAANYPVYSLYPGLHGKQSKATAGNCQGRFQPSVPSSDGQGTVISPAPLPGHRLWDGAQALPAKADLTEALSPNYLKISRSIITRIFTMTDTKLHIYITPPKFLHATVMQVFLCAHKHTSAWIIKTHVTTRKVSWLMVSRDLLSNL